MLRFLTSERNPITFYERWIPSREPGTEPLTDLRELGQPPRNPWAFMWFLARAHFSRPLVAMYALVIVGVAAESLGPFALNRMVDALTGVAAGSAAARDQAFVWLAILAGLWLVSELLFRAYEIVDTYTGPRLRAVAQKYLFRYLLGHSPRYFQDNFAGRLAQKIKQAGQSAVMMIYLLVRDGPQIIVLLTVSAILLAIEGPLYAVILVVWTVVYLVGVAWLARHCVQLSRNFSDAWSVSSGKMVDTISNADIVRAFARTGHERTYVSGYLFDEMAASMRTRWFLTVMRAFQSTALWVIRLVLIGYALYEVLAGALSIGAFTMIFLLVSLIAQNLKQLSFQMLDFFEFLGNLTEALEVISEPHEITDAPGARPLIVSKGHIAFRNVHFAHADGTHIFRGLNLDIRPGEKVGLVGRSGAGKSTLVKLLRRQADPQSGEILIDGQNIAHVTWASLNEAIAEVPQQPGIFHRTVRDNIRYHDPTASDEAVEEAARLAHAHEFIVKRGTGYDTLVGEQGIKLSGGERQRIAIARAFIKNARILVLDEATSALDSESEHLIQEALWDLMKGRTVIAIAHRLSTITGMDRIILMDRGRIIEEGSHADLISRGGHYARLWNRQVAGFAGVA
jgi:ATP-binding cassette subfamily B protein